MGSDKKMWRETSRWLRVGALSVSAISPFINILLARLRANIEAEEVVAQLKKDELEQSAQSAQREMNLDWQERLQAVGATVNDLLLEMRESPYAQRLQQQGENLKERSNKLSQAVAERSGQLTQDLAERSSDLKERGSKLSQTVAERGGQLTQDLAERSSRLTQDLAGRSSEISQELALRSRRARQELTGRDRNTWILLGFGSGLIATAIITYVLVRRRLQRSAEEEPPIQLLYDNAAPSVGNAASGRGSIYSVSANGTKLEAQTGAPTDTASEAMIPLGSAEAAATAPAGDSAEAPTEAAFVGVSSTKQYYPAETPLDQLHVTNAEAGDVVYFTSEDEAQRLGFSAAAR